LINPYTNKEYAPHIAKSPTGNPLTKFVNLCQTAEERRDKYNFCREFGSPVWIARLLRDWNWPKINLYLEAFYKSKQLQMIFTSPGGALSPTVEGVIE